MFSIEKRNSFKLDDDDSHFTLANLSITASSNEQNVAHGMISRSVPESDSVETEWNASKHRISIPPVSKTMPLLALKSKAFAKASCYSFRNSSEDSVTVRNRQSVSFWRDTSGNRYVEKMQHEIQCITPARVSENFVRSRNSSSPPIQTETMSSKNDYIGRLRFPRDESYFERLDPGSHSLVPYKRPIRALEWKKAEPDNSPTCTPQGVSPDLSNWDVSPLVYPQSDEPYPHTDEPYPHRDKPEKISSKINVLTIVSVVIISLTLFSFCHKRYTPDLADVSMIPSRINNSLNHELFGQKSISERFPTDLSGFLTDPNYKLAIVLLIGSPGSGKTLTSRIIQAHLRQTEFDVYEWHLDGNNMPDFKIACDLSFGKNRNKYLAMFLEDAGQSLPRVVEQIKEILTTEAYKSSNKTIVTITSTILSRDINNLMFDKCRVDEDGINLDEIIAEMLENKLSLKARLASLHSHLELRCLVYPFVPLEERDVRMCIRVELARRNIPDLQWQWITENVLMELSFRYQCGRRISETGCKMIKSRIDYILNKYK